MGERKFVQMVLVTWSHDKDGRHGHIWYKPFKNLLLQNQKADDLGTWYVASGMWGLPSLFNDDLRLTLTYLTSRSNLLPNAFKWGNFLKVDFLKTTEANVITLS